MLLGEVHYEIRIFRPGRGNSERFNEALEKLMEEDKGH